MARISDAEIWSFFLGLFGGNEYGASGACGNMQFESGLRTDNCEDKWNDQTGISDTTATNNINNGTWNLNHFLYGSNTATSPISGWWVNNVGWGYGLSQWTTTDRRTRLWQFTRGQGLGIDSVQGQLNYLRWEFTEGGWQSVRNKMSNATSVAQATQIYLDEYEGGAPSSSRYRFANNFYNNFAGTTPITGNSIRLHVQGNGTVFATKHLNETEADQIFSAEAGEDVFIHAVAGAGDTFLIWTADYPSSLVIDFDTSPNTFFTMPNSVVDVTAHFTGVTPEPPIPPEPPPYYDGRYKPKKPMPIWMYPYRR